jgi:hypothetical protein
MELWVKNTFTGLVPMYGSDYDNKRKLKVGKEYLVKVTAPRNYEFHKKMWALYNMLYQNQERYNNIDDLREDLTIEAGFYRESINIHGEVVKKAESISFANMDEVKFSELYNRTIDAIVQHFHFDKQSIIDEVSQYY